MSDFVGFMKNRNGSYKKILIDSDTLKAHSTYLREGIEALGISNSSPWIFTTLYLLLFLRIRHPKNWLQKRTGPAHRLDVKLEDSLLILIPQCFALNDWEKEKLNSITPVDLFASFNLKGIPKSINQTMIHWMKGEWKIDLLEYIPGPQELLRLQVKNTRCITLITNPKQIDSLVLSSRDPLSFALHDLMHAYQFFSQRQSQKGQLGFYRLIDSLYGRMELCEILKSDKNFKKEFEYITSDMNAYVVHLFKSLKCSILKTENGEFFFRNLLIWWEMNEDEKKSSHLLNTPCFSLEDEIILKNFFEKKQTFFK